MSRRVWKFGPFIPLARYSIEMPVGAVIRHFAAVGKDLFLWAECDPAAAKEQRDLWISGTGFDLPEGTAYRGTTFEDGFIWHLYEGVAPGAPEAGG